jgi:hypothetical protein
MPLICGYPWRYRCYNVLLYWEVKALPDGVQAMSSCEALHWPLLKGNQTQQFATPVSLDLLRPFKHAVKYPQFVHHVKCLTGLVFAIKCSCACFNKTSASPIKDTAFHWHRGRMGLYAVSYSCTSLLLIIKPFLIQGWQTAYRLIQGWFNFNLPNFAGRSHLLMTGITEGVFAFVGLQEFSKPTMNLGHTGSFVFSVKALSYRILLKPYQHGEVVLR